MSKLRDSNADTETFQSSTWDQKHNKDWHFKFSICHDYCVMCCVCAAALSQYRIKQNSSPQLQISPDPISVSSLSLSTGPGCTPPPVVLLLVLVACIAFFINLLHAQSNELEHKPSLCVWWSSYQFSILNLELYVDRYIDNIIWTRIKISTRQDPRHGSEPLTMPSYSPTFLSGLY